MGFASSSLIFALTFICGKIKIYFLIYRLLQSMIFEQVNSGSVQGDLQNILSVLQQLSMDHNTEVRHLVVFFLTVGYLPKPNLEI